MDIDLNLNIYKPEHIKFIEEITKIESDRIINSDTRRFNRSEKSIYNSTFVGHLAELHFSLLYRIGFQSFRKQIFEKIEKNQFSPYDIVYKDLKIEIKYVSIENLQEPNFFPIDHTSRNLQHPKHWRKKYGGCDYYVLFFNLNNKMTLLGEVSWNDYYKYSFKYGRAKNGQKYYDKIKQNPYLERKIMLSYKYLKEKNYYLPS